MRSGSIPRRLIGLAGGLDNGNLRHDVPFLDLHDDIHSLHDLAEHCVPAVQRGLWRQSDIELTPGAVLGAATFAMATVPVRFCAY